MNDACSAAGSVAREGTFVSGEWISADVGAGENLTEVGTRVVII